MHSIRDTPEAESDQKRKVAEIKRTAKGTWRRSMVAKEQRRPDCLRKTRQGGRNRVRDPGRIAVAVAPGSFENHWIAGAKEHRIGIVARRRFRTGVGGIVIRGRFRRIIPVVRAARAVRVPMLPSSPGGMQVNMRPSIASAWATRTMAERD